MSEAHVCDFHKQFLYSHYNNQKWVCTYILIASCWVNDIAALNYFLIYLKNICKIVSIPSVTLWLPTKWIEIVSSLLKMAHNYFANYVYV